MLSRRLLQRKINNNMKNNECKNCGGEGVLTTIIQDNLECSGIKCSTCSKTWNIKKPKEHFNKDLALKFINKFDIEGQKEMLAYLFKKFAAKNLVRQSFKYETFNDPELGPSVKISEFGIVFKEEAPMPSAITEEACIFPTYSLMNPEESTKKTLIRDF